MKPGLTTDAAAEIKRLQKENAELRKANEILKVGVGDVRGRVVTGWGGSRPRGSVATKLPFRSETSTRARCYGVRRCVPVFCCLL